MCPDRREKFSFFVDKQGRMVRAHPRRSQERVFITHVHFCSIPRVREIIILTSVAFQLTPKTLDKGEWGGDCEPVWGTGHGPQVSVLGNLLLMQNKNRLLWAQVLEAVELYAFGPIPQQKKSRAYPSTAWKLFLPSSPSIKIKVEPTSKCVGTG